MSKQVSNKSKYLVSPKLIVVIAAVVTLILTPWYNVDSLVVPKLIFLFCASLYVLPIIFYKKNSSHEMKILYFILSLILIQVCVSIFSSDSPLEQQVFGRTGRGLGLIVYVSLLILTIASAKLFHRDNIELISLSIVWTNLFSSIYSILQKFGLDLMDWDTRTNGIIGTLGNPNFQAAFSGMALVPTLVFAYKQSRKTRYTSYLLVFVTLIAIFYTQSTQGYIISIISILSFTLFFLWFNFRNFFKVLFPSVFIFFFITALGIFNSGPLSRLLYKASIESRAEFWRTSWAAAIDNPYTGVGIDSLGDYSRVYRSPSDALGINENFDNAHNQFLEAAATGGFPLLLLNSLFIVFTLIMFYRAQKKLGKFDARFSSLFTIWLAFQAQSMISPGSIALFVWNTIVSGAVIGTAISLKVSQNSSDSFYINNIANAKVLQFFLLIISILIAYPYFNADKLQYSSFTKSDALLAVKAATTYPESSVRYNQIGLQLLKSNLPDQALVVARSAVSFNPNAITGWALLYSNPKATEIEKKKALIELRRLDPNNKELKKLK
jgi:O-antigen ligase